MSKYKLKSLFDKTLAITYYFEKRSSIVTTLPASKAKTILSQLIDQSAETHQPIIISEIRRAHV